MVMAGKKIDIEIRERKRKLREGEEKRKIKEI